MRKLLSVAALVLGLVAAPMKDAHALADGTPSTGSFTIVTNSALAAATATGTATIVTTTSLAGAKLTIGAQTFVAGRDFTVGASTAITAISLAASINARAGVQVTAAFAQGDTSIALTALSPGSLYNSVSLLTNDTDRITVGAATLTGGQNNAIVYINAIPLVQGRDWFALDVASNTAVNLAAAINHNLQTSQLVNAQQLGAGSAVVYLRSVISPVAYTLSDSAGSAITSPTATMTGGSGNNLLRSPCFLGVVESLPTANYGPGCLAILRSQPATIYLSTEAVVGSQSWARGSQWSTY